MAAFGKELLLRREANHAAVADHLHIAAKVAGGPHDVLCGTLAHKALLRVAVFVGLFLAVENVNDIFVQYVLDVAGEAAELGLDCAESL